LLYKNDDELVFLKEWLLRKSDHKEEKEPNADKEPLQIIVKNCSRCGKIDAKRYGWGTGRNSIMIIMNTPVNISMADREDLKEQSKELLKNMIKAINVDLRDCYVTNLIKCEVETFTKGPGFMLKNCLPILKRELSEYNPNIVIIMGDSLPIKRLVNENSNRKWFSVDHPIALIKNKGLKKSAWVTLQKIMAEIKSTQAK
jgi:uracil-DNA glycosylase family 4